MALKELSLQKTSQKLLEPATHRGAASSWLLFEDRLSATVQEVLALVVALLGVIVLYDL